LQLILKSICCDLHDCRLEDGNTHGMVKLYLY